MTYRNGALHCDRFLCPAQVPHWVRQLARELARSKGWHVQPCNCEWRNMRKQEWKHDNDYCPDHFPQEPRYMETVRSPLL
jgi:hypothetical protein